ncbi:nucleotidyltransferase family protein [Sphingomonas sp. H39-1-10]|uniref:nucleotidyltransferase family protein n=1 Tax=Sphingomonas pollutisoli TaxID=3030829 RepID=UPI0023B96651|nr:nucleotidyltransferase family protein [Sphingomonas pollutisoli]MDF0487000.1 nucleotidyltransferase family protein [Sphingomonas pollutisoli]
MIAPDRLAPARAALVLLAAGKSERFGLSDKLGAPFLGKPLGYHVVTALAAVPFQARIAVCDGGALDYAARGYQVVVTDRAEAGVSYSVRRGVKAARAAGCDAVLLALADMPRVTAAHIYRLFDASTGAETVVASSDGTQPRPPALFGRAHFDALETLQGDTGARHLILAGKHVVTDADELVDIDTEEELAYLQAKFGQGRAPAFAKDA